jgi:hypothetical protein
VRLIRPQSPTGQLPRDRGRLQERGVERNIGTHRAVHGEHPVRPDELIELDVMDAATRPRFSSGHGRHEDTVVIDMHFRDRITESAVSNSSVMQPKTLP